jgi:uncharacterized protein YggU (UPF0235/DUF167 family)
MKFIDVPVRVTPHAKQKLIYAEGAGLICKVNAPPVDAKANE